MSVTATNLIMGPADLYTGAFGATEPLDTAIATAPDNVAWTDMGGSNGGVKITVDQKYTELEVDQIVDVPARRLTSRDLMLELSLAEPTLENLAVVMNAGTVTAGTGVKSLEPVFGSSATQPNYTAMIVDGYAPDSKRRRLIVRKTLSTDKVETSYEKDKQTLFKATFSAHYVSPSVAPFRVIDQTA